ncbi:MAG: hypothetical protein KR126chlam2_00748 [Chlamydiae bacterium]|nr:hypothetical protein [Chlamydiota bacterium]
MTPIDFSSAQDNVDLFIQFKAGSTTGNFAKLKLKMDDRSNIEVDRSTNNVARFAATFFTLGLYQGYRRENKLHSVEVQTILGRSVTALLETRADGLTEAQCVAREKALKTYDAILFTRHGNFFSRCLGNFYYWVLGAHNVRLEKQEIVFSSRAQVKLQALHNAARSSAAPPPASSSTPALAASAASPPLALTSSSALAPVRHSEGNDAVAPPLAPLQLKYVDLVKASLVAEENFISTTIGCATVSQFNIYRKMVEKAQNAAVSGNIYLFIEKWHAVDMTLAITAAEADYVNRDEATRVIEAYYKHLVANTGSAAQMRRLAEERMTALTTEVCNEVILGLLGDLSAKRYPSFSRAVNEKIDGHQNEVIKGDEKTICSLVFRVFSDLINAKLTQRYSGELSSENRPLIDYQALMIGLKVFGGFENLLQLLKQSNILPSSETSAEDRAFRAAFGQYASVIKAEQRVNIDLMQKLGNGKLSEITIEDYWASAEDTMSSQSSFAPLSPSSSLASSSQAFELPDLDINSLGIGIDKPTPDVQKKAAAFSRQLLRTLFLYSLKFFEIVNRETREASERRMFPQLEAGHTLRRLLGNE